MQFFCKVFVIRACFQSGICASHWSTLVSYAPSVSVSLRIREVSSSFLGTGDRRSELRFLWFFSVLRRKLCYGLRCFEVDHEHFFANHSQSIFVIHVFSNVQLSTLLYREKRKSSNTLSGLFHSSRCFLFRYEQRSLYCTHQSVVRCLGLAKVTDMWSYTSVSPYVFMAFRLNTKITLLH